MNILITSGGTIENIDAVRCIANTSTGRLGCAIAETFAEENAVQKIFFFAGQNSVLPDCKNLPTGKKVFIKKISNTEALVAAIKEIASKNKIALVIHAMAVSDFRITKLFLADDGQCLQDAQEIDRTKKISSDLHGKKLIAVFEETEKVIKLFKEIIPDAPLVGFKLLDNVTHEELLEAAQKLLHENNCTFVLANDAKDIFSDDAELPEKTPHKGYLVGSKGEIAAYNNKKEIAIGIKEHCLKLLGVLGV